MIDRETRDMFATAKNPIFEYERRRMRWVKDIASLTQYARRLWIGSSIAAVVLWLTGTLIAGDDTSFQGNLVLLWVYAALLVMVVVDLYTAFVVAGNLHRQIHSDQWELILISRQPNRSTFRAEYAVAQLRTWRPMIIETSLRIGAVEILVLGLARIVIGSIGDFTSIECFVLMILGFVIAIYVLEPIWRMKALTAISIAAVSMVKNAAFAYLALFGAIAVIHILQFAVLAGVWYFFGGFSRFGDAFYFLVLCGIPSDTIVGFCFTYLFYSLIKQLALSVAYKRMFAPDA